MPDLACLECGTPFVPRDPRQRCCSKRCGARRYEKSDAHRDGSRKSYHRHRDEIRARKAERYQNDETYRAKIVQEMRRRRAENPEHFREINAKHRAKPASRQSASHLSREWHASHKEYANGRRVVRKQSQRKSYPWVVSINSAKRRAIADGLEFDLTHEWGRKRWTGRCQVSNIPFAIGARGGARLFSPSLDKIIPALGYTQGNCRFVLWCVNAFKYTGTDEQMLMVARAIIRHQKRLKLKMPTEPKAREICHTDLFAAPAVPRSSSG